MRNDIEMRQVHHRHDSGFLPCQKTYKKQLLCKKWSFWWNMRWSTLTQKMIGCLIRFRHHFSSVAGWWVNYDVEMWHLYHRHDSGFLPCQRAYNKQQLCWKWTFCYNMGWSTVMQKNRGYFRRKTPFFVYFWQIFRFSARDIAYAHAADVSVLLPHFNISTPPWHGQVWGLNSYIWRSTVALYFFFRKKYANEEWWPLLLSDDIRGLKCRYQW